MTALIAFALPDAGYVYSDGAVPWPDGRISHFSQKITIFGQLRAVVGVTGAAEFQSQLAERCGDVATFDELRSTFSDLVRETHAYVLSHISVDPRLTALLVGWSEKEDRCEIYTVDSDAGVAAAWSRQGPGRASLSSYTPELASEIARGGLTLEDAAKNPAKLGPELMEAYRRAFIPATVGGFCQETVITAEGVTTRVVRRWPDRVGERIVG